MTIYLLQLDPFQQKTYHERTTGRIGKVQKLSRSKAEWHFLDIQRIVCKSVQRIPILMDSEQVKRRIDAIDVLHLWHGCQPSEIPYRSAVKTLDSFQW